MVLPLIPIEAGGRKLPALLVEPGHVQPPRTQYCFSGGGGCIIRPSRHGKPAAALGIAPILVMTESVVLAAEGVTRAICASSLAVSVWRSIIMASTNTARVRSASNDATSDTSTSPSMLQS